MSHAYATFIGSQPLSTNYAIAYICDRCRGRFIRGPRQVSCTVSHDLNVCCHYGEQRLST